MAQSQITIGLDFGTHQSKVCVERKNGAELEYQFFKFPDSYGQFQFTLPSIILIGNDGFLKYGYIPKNKKGKIVRYFKQATFTSVKVGLDQKDAIYYSIWYLAFILFDLENVYGQNFAIQMGVPSDGSHLENQRQLAVSLLLSAYNLVENVFENNKEKFLRTPFYKLRDKTTIIPYTKAQKEDYGLLVFPEAYACLMPLVSAKKIVDGISLMVDIGGGTTDISFFSIVVQQDPITGKKSSELKVYDFTSVNKGLNYVSHNSFEENDNRLDSNVKTTNELFKDAVNSLKNDLNAICSRLRGRLYKEFKTQGDLPDSEFEHMLSNRPIVYTGGGSSFSSLRIGYHGFKDIIHISQQNWRHELVEEMSMIQRAGLCPILSTAYGLSISRKDDTICCEPFRDLFYYIRQTKGQRHQKEPRKPKKPFGYAIGGHYGFSYTDDWDALK